jgi:glucan-binding YG repeat protein
MKKQTKVLATLSAAALLAVGFSAVSFAEGWDNSTGSWQYLDKDGEPVTDTWKSSNGQWFWLGDDGNMVTDSLIEDTTESKTKYYYVDANGARVSNTWKAVALDGSENTDIDAEYWWYYFGSDGKAYTNDADKELTKNKLKTINGLKYCFDDEGHMLYGWVNATNWEQQDDDDQAWEDSKWYFNGWNDGHAENGWKQLTVTNNNGDEKDYWFYFKNGEKKTGKQKVDGKTYLLAEDGHMLDEWVDLKGSTVSEVDASTTAATLKYTNGDGAERKNKWVWAIPSEDYNRKFVGDDYDKDEYSWWYYNKSGDLAHNEIKKINGKWYAFDAAGRMKTDFVVADDKTYVNQFGHDDFSRADFLTGSTELNEKLNSGDLYFYSTDEEKDGSRKTGYQNIELDDDVYQFYFDTKSGKATTGYVSKIKKYTVNGLVLKATDDDDSNYVGIKADYKGEVTPGDDLLVADEKTVGHLLVNKSGTVVVSKTKLRDENDHYYVVADTGDKWEPDKKGKVLMYFTSEDAYNAFFDKYYMKKDGTFAKVSAADIVKGELKLDDIEYLYADKNGAKQYSFNHGKKEATVVTEAQV